MNLVILEVPESHGHNGADSELVKSMEDESRERSGVVDPVRSLQTAVEQSNPHPQHHSILPFTYTEVLLHDKLDEESQTNISDNGSNYISLSMSSPWHII